MCGEAPSGAFLLYSGVVVIDPRETLEIEMAVAPKTDQTVTLTTRERGFVCYSLGLAIASKKRSLNAATTSDEMKAVIQVELADLQALWIRLQ